MIDELQRKLLYTTLELESVKMEADEIMKKNEENLKNLLHLLDLTYQERDDAREEIQKLMNKLVSTSPVDSFFHGASSPVFSNSSMADYGNLGFAQLLVDVGNSDPFSAVIDRFLMGKTLPQRGKLMKAVVDAGPLLQTLLLTGQLPQWRIPPPNQLIKIHPADLKPLNSSSPYLELCRGYSQTCSASTLNFTIGSSSSSSFPVYSFQNLNPQIPTGKRQRFH